MLKMMDFILKPMDFILKMMDFVIKVMDFVLNLIGIVLNMMNFTLKLMDLQIIFPALLHALSDKEDKVVHRDLEVLAQISRHARCVPFRNT